MLLSLELYPLAATIWSSLSALKNGMDRGAGVKRKLRMAPVDSRGQASRARALVSVPCSRLLYLMLYHEAKAKAAATTTATATNTTEVSQSQWCHLPKVCSASHMRTNMVAKRVSGLRHTVPRNSCPTGPSHSSSPTKQPGTCQGQPSSKRSPGAASGSCFLVEEGRLQVEVVGMCTHLQR